MLPKIIEYARNYDGKTKYMFFLIKDHGLLKKRVWDKVSVNKELDSVPIYNEKYLRTKISFYEGKINTIFHNDIMPKEVVIVFVYQ